MTPIDRRTPLNHAALAGGGITVLAWLPAWAQPILAGLTAPLPTLAGTDIALHIGRQTMIIDGHLRPAIGINGTVPGAATAPDHVSVFRN